MKEVGRSRTQLLDDLRNRNIYWELNKEAEEQKRWKQAFMTLTYGRHTLSPLLLLLLLLILLFIPFLNGRKVSGRLVGPGP